MDASVKRDIWLVNISGVMGSLYVQLAMGQFLILYISKCLGVPKEDWALAASFIPLTGAFHLVSTYLTEHWRRRKLLSLTCFSIGRLATPAIMLLPYITGPDDSRLRLFYLAVALVAQRTGAALGSSAWQSWIADIVPEEHRGRFFSTRFALTTLANVLVFLGAGLLIDSFDPASPTGYMGVFGFAFLAGELDLLLHARVADRPMPKPETAPRLRSLIAAPWRHSGFRSLMLYRTLVVFGNALIGPFAFYYLIEELGLNATQLSILMVILMLVQIPGFLIWRTIGERVGYRTVTSITCTLSGLGVMYWWFVPQGNFLVFFTVLILARVFFGLTSAGTALSDSTLTMNVAPKTHRSAYFAQVTTIIAMASALGIFCGRLIFIHVDPWCGGTFLGTKLTGVHVLIGLLGLTRIVSIRLFYRNIPDAKAEAAMPRIARILRTNTLRIFPTLLTLERPISDRKRAEHIDSIKRLIPAPKEDELKGDLEAVLRDRIHAENEFYGILDKMRAARGKDIEPMTAEIGESPGPRLSTAKAKGAASRIKRLFSKGDLAACLRTIQRLAHQAADEWNSASADTALSVVDSLADRLAAGKEPGEEAVQLALYAYLQIVRGQERSLKTRGVENLVNEITESAVFHLSSVRARAAANRIKRLYGEGDLGGCLRTVRRLAHRTADEWRSPIAASALAVIDALTQTLSEYREPQEDAVLLALYAYLQIVREQTPDEQ